MITTTELSDLLTKDALEFDCTPQEQAYALYSDLHKEEYGVRARFAADYSFEELVESIMTIYNQRQNLADMKRREKEARENALRKATTPTPVAILGDFWPQMARNQEKRVLERFPINFQ